MTKEEIKKIKEIIDEKIFWIKGHRNLSGDYSPQGVIKILEKLQEQIEEIGEIREKGYEKAKKGLNKLKKSWGRAY